MVRRGSAKPQTLVQIQSVTQNWRLAQLGERLRDMQKVTGSSPVSPTNAFVAQLVEQLICNQQVAGSIPVEGSKWMVIKSVTS